MTEVFEYALVRVVPRIERGESINAGVIVYSKSFRFLRARIGLDEGRLRAVDPGADIPAVAARSPPSSAPAPTARSPSGPWASASAG